MAGYTRQASANIVTGAVIDAADFNAEYNAIEGAFNASTGHNHDGTTGNGPGIEVLGPAADFVVTSSVARPKTTNTYDLGTSTIQWKDAFFDGTLRTDVLTVDETTTLTGNVTAAADLAVGGDLTTTGTITGTLSSSSLASITTDNVGEGSSNLYHTDARARAALSAGTGISYNSTSGAITCTVDTPAEVGLSNLSNNGNNVTGDFTASGNITAYSDERLKENVQTIEGALDKVSQMRGVTYNYKSELKDGQRGTGVIAQEMQQVMPEVIEEGEYLSVAYGNLVGVLIEAVKELKAELDQCKCKKCECE